MIACMPPGHCLAALETVPVEIYNFLKGWSFWVCEQFKGQCYDQSGQSPWPLYKCMALHYTLARYAPTPKNRYAEVYKRTDP